MVWNGTEWYHTAEYTCTDHDELLGRRRRFRRQFFFVVVRGRGAGGGENIMHLLIDLAGEETLDISWPQSFATARYSSSIVRRYLSKSMSPRGETVFFMVFPKERRVAASSVRSYSAAGSVAPSVIGPFRCFALLYGRGGATCVCVCFFALDPGFCRIVFEVRGLRRPPERRGREVPETPAVVARPLSSYARFVSL